MKIIAACCKNFGIGIQNKIPWHISEEFKYFKKMTTHGDNPTVIMGRNTWESLPKKPLDKRKNIIISKTLKQKDVAVYKNTFVSESISGIHYLTEKKDPVWILGGEKIYHQMIHSKEINEIYLTFIDKNPSAGNPSSALELVPNCVSILPNENFFCFKNVGA